MTRIAGTLALEMEISDAKLRTQYRSLIEELKRTVVPIQLVPTVTGAGGAAAGGGGLSGGLSSAAAATFTSSTPAGVTSSAFSYTPAAAAFQAVSPSPGPAPQGGGLGFPFTGGQLFAAAGWAGGGGGGTATGAAGGGGGGAAPAAAAGMFGRANSWLRANTPSLFRLLVPLHVAREGFAAIRTAQEMEEGALLAQSPLEALQARAQGIDRLTSGTFGGPLGFLADLTGYGPASIHASLRYESARQPILEATRQSGLRVANSQAARAAFAAGGTTAQDVERRRAATNLSVGRLQEEFGQAGFQMGQIYDRAEHSTWWDRLLTPGAPLFGGMSGADAGQLAALQARQRSITREQIDQRRQAAADEDLATSAGEQRRAGIIASRNRWRDVEAGTPTFAVERRAATAQHEIERRELVKTRPEDVPAFDEEFRAQTAAEDAVRGRGLARDFRLAGAAALSSRLRIDRRPLAARLNDIQARGEYEATAEGIDPAQAFLARQRAYGEAFETIAVTGRENYNRVTALQREAGVLRARARGDTDTAERLALQDSNSRRLQSITGDDAGDERRAELQRQQAEWDVLVRDQTLRRQFRRTGLAIAEETSRLEADRQPYTAAVRSIARTARLRDREAEAAGFDPDERALMLADAQNRLGLLREQLTKGAAVAGNPFLTDFSGKDDANKDVLGALKEIKTEVERLNELMKPLADL